METDKISEKPSKQTSNNCSKSILNPESQEEDCKMATTEEISECKQLEEMMNGRKDDKTNITLNKDVVMLSNVENENLQDENENKVQLSDEASSSKQNVDDISIDLPSTSGSDSSLCKVMKKNTASVDQNSTNKRSKSKEDDDFTMKDENTLDEDSGKRQKMNETEDDDDERHLDLSTEVFLDSEALINVRIPKRNISEVFPNNESPNPQSDILEALQEHSNFISDQMDTTERSWSDDDSSLHEMTDSTEDLDTENFSDMFPTSDNNDSDGWVSSTSSSADEDMEEEECNPPVLQKEPPKHTWFPLRELVSRQLGINQTLPEKFYGSLYAVQILDLSCKLQGHKGCVNTINFNKKGNLLASASDDLNVIIWDWAAKRKVSKYKSGHRSNVFQAKWLPLDEENLMVTSARDGHVRLLDLETGTHRRIGLHAASCNKIATHDDTPHVVLSAGEDSRVMSIDVRENSPTKLLKVKEGENTIQLYSIHSNPFRSNEFCVAGQMSAVRIYDRRHATTPIQKMCPNHLINKKYSNITCAVYNHNGTEILASYNDEDIYLFDTVNPRPFGEFAHSYQGHRNSITVKGVSFFGPKSEYVMSGSDCKNIFIWDKNTEAIVQWMEGDKEGTINCVEPHPHIPVMATSGLDYDVKIWIPSSQKSHLELASLERCVKTNLNKVRKARQEPLEEGNIWNLLRDLHRHIHRNGENVFRSDNGLESDSNSSDTDYEGRLQCPTS